MKLAYDMSAMLWNGMKAGTDPEGIRTEFEGKKIVVNTARYAYENVMNKMLGAMKAFNLAPIDCILVFEGLNSKSRRQYEDKAYKADRDHAPEEYVEFQKVRDQIADVWRKVGAMALQQDYAEGDDTLGWLAHNTREDLVIATTDNDLSVCNTEIGETNEYGAKVIVWVDGLIGVNKYGLFPYRYVSLYKALVGDTSDHIKGVPGFGKTAFDSFCQAYGFDGLQELQDMCEAGQLVAELHETAQEIDKKGKPVHKLVRLICDHEKELMTCWKLTKLHPEWVNTDHAPLKITPGMVLPAPTPADERLKSWYGQRVLVTGGNFDAVCQQVARHLPQSPFFAFDIETSSAPESDDWLAAKGDPEGVDQMGSKLTGFSFTFGRNLQLTIYVSVDHAETNNVTMSQARHLIELFTKEGQHKVESVPLRKHDIVIHNTHFELPLLYMAEDEDGTLWRDHWKNNGYHGFLPRALDTKLEASYVNENQKLGLKHRSKTELNYDQTSYDAVTKLKLPVEGRKPYAGGRLIGLEDTVVKEAVIVDDKEVEPAVKQQVKVWRYKMNELPAAHVFDYGCDDTVCTAALHVYYRFVMEFEGTWDVYKQVEIDAAYQHAKNFVDGMPYSVEKGKELERLDDVVYSESWAKLRAYLISKNWVGTVPPAYTPKIAAKEVKEAYTIVTGKELVTQVRTPAKLLKLIEGEGDLAFAAMLVKCLEDDEGAKAFTTYVQSYFKGEPVINLDSPKQMASLLFETMALPVQIRNKPTAIMRKNGVPGSAKTDELAIKYSMRVASPELKEVLESLWLMRMVMTRRELYYAKYPHCIHWKTGRIHGSHNQCATNTRRASESDPNKQQQPKHPKVELSLVTDERLIAAVVPRFRETIVPHKPGAVVVSMDFKSQELVVIGDYSRDQNLVACFIGENKKDMHSLTGVAILNALVPEHKTTTYEQFVEWVHQTELDDIFKKSPIGKLVKDYRARGKKTNFTTEYGAMAPKLAATMLVSEEEAQIFIDARESMFPGVVAWKDSVRQEAKDKGFVCTMLGARRHLRDALNSDDGYERSKAERQAVNFKVQSSCAEMTKLAEGRMWQRGLFFRYDAVCLGPIHDEIVASVMVDEHFADFIREMHECMVAPYANMWMPIVSSISFGPSFGEQFEVGEEPTPEAVAEGLAAMRKAMKSSKEKMTI